MAHRVATSCCLARATWRRKASSQFYRQLLRARHAHQMMPGASYSSDSKLTTGRGLLDRDLGQPSHFTHPSLIGEEEGELSCNAITLSKQGRLGILYLWQNTRAL